MSEADYVAIGGFVALFVLMGLRVPIGIAMGLVGTCGFGLLTSPNAALSILAQTPIATLTNYSLTLIPFFIVMGVFATNSGMSKEIFAAGQAWFGAFRGGAALSTIGACAGFAAISGSSVATAATMSKVALPEMRRFDYPDRVSSGVVAAGGTLGILIPPSAVLAVYGFITEQDIGKLFIAGIVPGLLAVVMYMATVRIYYGRSLPKGDPFDLRRALASLRGIWAVFLLFLAVMGSIYLGIASPTDAAGIGAVLTAIIGLARRRLRLSTIFSSVIEALYTSAAIYSVLIGAMLFSYFLAITQTPQKITGILIGFDAGAYGTLALILCFFLLMGAIFDAMAMVILLVPIVFPAIVQLGFDPLWFGVIVVMTVELALITPPIGMNVFVLNSVNRDIGLGTIFKGVLPFVVTDLLRLILLIALPALVLFLPGTIK